MIEYGSKIIMLLLENKKIKNKKVKILRFSKRPGLKKISMKMKDFEEIGNTKFFCYFS